MPYSLQLSFPAFALTRSRSRPDFILCFSLQSNTHGEEDGDGEKKRQSKLVLVERCGNGTAKRIVVKFMLSTKAGALECFGIPTKTLQPLKRMSQVGDSKNVETIVERALDRPSSSPEYVLEEDSRVWTILEEFDFTDGGLGSLSLSNKELSWLPDSVKDFILPAGFPGTVSDDYLDYMLLQFPTNVTGWICHTLVTSSLLKAVGVGSFSGSTAAATAAAIRWVSKDGLGAVGRLFIGGRFGNLFDDDPKQWRIIFDLCTPLFPSYFLALASLGNLTKAVGKGLKDPSFRVIQNHFAVSGNLGEVAAKEEVWEVVAQLIGLALGVLVLLGYKLQAIISGYTWHPSFIHYVSVHMVEHAAISHMVTLSVAYRYVDCNREENILVWQRFSKPQITFGVSLEEMISQEESISTVKALLKLYAREEYILSFRRPGSQAAISFKVGATSLSVLRSLWQTYWLYENCTDSCDSFNQLEQSLLELENEFDDFLKQLEEGGWDVNQLKFKRSPKPPLRRQQKQKAMRFNFDDTSKADSSPERSPTTTATPNHETEWIPLHNHPVFAATPAASAAARTRTNLLAWDGDSRLYFWDSTNNLLHRLRIRLADPDPDPSVLASSLTKVLLPDGGIDFAVNAISINRNGSALLISGSEGLRVMYLFGKTSAKDNAIICKTISVGSKIYFEKTSPIRTIQASWHPYSETHLGVLSSDSVFRLFDLSSNLEKAEQEFYLQPVEPGKCSNAASICAVGFSFGGEHLWDRFTVFFLFSDGSIYLLCPIVPFGRLVQLMQGWGMMVKHIGMLSLLVSHVKESREYFIAVPRSLSIYRQDSVVEIYNDTQAFGLEASNSQAVKNSRLAITWLESTFPQLDQVAGSNSMMLRSRPYAPFDASLSLQGPLRKVFRSQLDEDSEVRAAERNGKTVGFLYNSISKDSILVTAWSNGQLQIDALADEIQPVWNVDSAPSLSVDSHDRVLGLAMICESNPVELSIVKLSQSFDSTVWSGHPPPLLRLAVVDLALPENMDNNSLLSLFNDTLIPERIYCLHGGGVDSVVLHFLPFTGQANGKGETMRAPTVYPVLSTCQSNSSSPSPLCGFVSLADSFGYSWIVGVTLSQQCIVLEAKAWSVCLPFLVDGDKELIPSKELKGTDTPDIISPELLSGPKVVVIPQVMPNLRSVAADSIEGRSLLHQYFKLFHENYVEYAHKVWFELKHHGGHLKRLIDDQNARLHQAQQKLSNVEEKQSSLDNRMNHAVEVQKELEERMQTLRRLPGTNKKPLSRAELDFKAELDRFTGVELDAIRSSIRANELRKMAIDLFKWTLAAVSRFLAQLHSRLIVQRAEGDAFARLTSYRHLGMSSMHSRHGWSKLIRS
ncbi:hypothetical protein Sjap_014085 [Stephania japonica]|uniref:Uncharacterized protein n=1 Tax=Stephania japonica TaxID=461633 RepID=A0AAP0IZ89_9MAGN